MLYRAFCLFALRASKIIQKSASLSVWESGFAICRSVSAFTIDRDDLARVRRDRDRRGDGLELRQQALDAHARSKAGTQAGLSACHNNFEKGRFFFLHATARRPARIWRRTWLKPRDEPFSKLGRKNGPG